MNRGQWREWRQWVAQKSAKESEKESALISRPKVARNQSKLAKLPKLACHPWPLCGQLGDYFFVFLFLHDKNLFICKVY